MGRIGLRTTLGTPLFRYANDDLALLQQLLRQQRADQSGTWYHASPHDLPEGTKLIPGGASAASQGFYDEGFGNDRGTLQDMGGGRPQHVWMTPDREDANFWSAVNGAPHIYEVKPHEEPRPWNGTGIDGWVAPGATIKRKVSASSMSWEVRRQQRNPDWGHLSSGPQMRHAHRELTLEEWEAHKEQGWRGPPCENPTHHGVIGQRCTECGRRVAPQKVAAVKLSKTAKKWDEPGTKCKYCKSPPTYAILHSEGMAYVQTCDKHLDKGKKAAEGCVPFGPPDPGNIIKVKKLGAYFTRDELAEGARARTLDFARDLLAYVDESPWFNAVYDEDLDEDDEDKKPGRVMVRKRLSQTGVESTMNVRKQVNKFDDRINNARQSGDHPLADYYEHLKGLMLDAVEQGRPQPFSHFAPMAEEEFDL